MQSPNWGTHLPSGHIRREETSPLGNPSLGGLPLLVFQGALAEGAGRKGPTGRGAGKQNGELEGEGCGWAPIQPTSYSPTAANPLPGRHTLKAGAWRCLLGGGCRNRCMCLGVKGLICRSNTPTLSCGLRLRLCYFTGLRPTPGGGRKAPKIQLSVLRPTSSEANGATRGACREHSPAFQ